MYGGVPVSALVLVSVVGVAVVSHNSNISEYCPH